MAAIKEAPEQTSTELNVVDIRNELLGMLERAGGAAPPKPVVRAAEPVAEVKSAVPVKGAGKSGGKGEAAAVEEPPVDPDVTCVKCGNKDSWGTASWCPKCGYYPGIGHEGEIPQEESDGIENLTFLDFCPPWAIKIVVGGIVITLATVFLEKSLTGELGLLSLMSLIQLCIGGLLIIFAHNKAILAGLHDPGTPGVIALITYPPAVWMPVLKNLRERSHLLVTLSWGLCATALALTIYGPIHLDEIQKELAATKKDRKPLMGRILGGMMKVASVSQGPPPNVDMGNSGSLEDAIGGFANLATEQGGLGEIAEAAQGGGIDNMMQASVASAVAGTGVGPNALAGGGNLDLGGGGGGGSGGLDGAIGEFANVATGQADLNNPEELAKLTAGRSGTGAIQSPDLYRGGSGTSSPPQSGPQSNQYPLVAAGGGSPAGVKPKNSSSSSPRTSAGGASTSATVKQAVVFGYLVSAGGEIRTLLIATAGPDGRPRFAGKLGSDAMSDPQWASIIESLPGMRTGRPLVACPNSGHWVEPKFMLNIDSDRWTPTGPVDAQVQSVERR